MRILFCGDSPIISTGFGIVSKNILAGLQKLGHEIHVLGINWYGNPYDHKEFPYEMWPCDKGPIEVVYGYSKLWWIANQVKPDLIFFLNDPWVIQKYIEHRPPDTNPYLHYMAYFPLDSGPLKPAWAKILTDMDAQA